MNHHNAHGHGFQKRRGEAEVDFELNLAPIIDCFVVLITYMLVSASFLSLGILDIGAQGNGTAEVNAKIQKDPVVISLILNAGRDVVIRISGKSRSQNRIQNAEGEVNIEQVTAHLNQIKKQYPNVEAVLVSAQDNVDYNELVTLIGTIKPVFPLVSLGEDDS